MLHMWQMMGRKKLASCQSGSVAIVSSMHDFVKRLLRIRVTSASVTGTVRDVRKIRDESRLNDGA